MCDESFIISKNGKMALKWFLEMIIEIYNRNNISKETEIKSAYIENLIDILISRVIDCCYGNYWHQKIGGYFGIEVTYIYEILLFKI